MIVISINCSVSTGKTLGLLVGANVMTYGSGLRFENIATGFFLRSANMHYGSGSRQQIVTAYREFSDWDGLWHIKEAHGKGPKTLNEPIKCGDVIRAEHVRTGKNLHSHPVSSWLA